MSHLLIVKRLELYMDLALYKINILYYYYIIIYARDWVSPAHCVIKRSVF